MDLSSPSGPGTTADSIHASLMQVFDAGVLILGESGSGKSDACLGLVSRGHVLVADDVVELRAHRDQLFGSAPAGFAGRLHIRGLGIIDVPAAFGFSKSAQTVRVHLACKLLGPADKYPDIEPAMTSFLNRDIPLFELGKGEHRDLPLLIETAARMAMRARNDN